MSNTTKTIIWVLVAAGAVVLAVVIFNSLLGPSDGPIIVLKPKRPPGVLGGATGGAAAPTDLGWFSKESQNTPSTRIERGDPALPPDGNCGLRSDFVTERVKFFKYTRHVEDTDTETDDLREVTIVKGPLELTIEKVDDHLEWYLEKGLMDCSDWKPVEDDKRVPSEFEDLMAGVEADAVYAVDANGNVVTDVFLVTFLLK